MSPKLKPTQYGTCHHRPIISQQNPPLWGSLIWFLMWRKIRLIVWFYYPSLFFSPQVSMFLSSMTKNSRLKYCPQIFTPKPVYRLIRPTTALQITTSITLSSRLMFLRVDKNWPFLFLFQHKPVDKPRRANANRIPEPTKVIITRYND